MSVHDVRFPGESEAYRSKRDELLHAEMELRDKIEEVAALRRQLPPGGPAQDYTFVGADGEVRMSELFNGQPALIVYSFMFAAADEQPCPLCSAFMDSLNGQLKHITQQTALVVVARSPYRRLAELAQERGWQDITWLSAAQNSYAADYRSEMPDGAQVPMCNVFVREQGATGGIRHFWNSELFFAPANGHPRHVDNLWPLWSFFDLTPAGRGDFMPRLNYNE